MTVIVIAALAYIAGLLTAGGALLVFAAWTTRDLEEVEREYDRRRHLAAVPGGHDLVPAAQPTFVANSPELVLS